MDDIAQRLKAAAAAIGGPAGAHEPDWRPLEAVLPIEECAGFMFMGYATSLDGRSLRLYKHGITRRYLILDEQLRPHVYTPSGDYVAMPRGLGHAATLEAAIDAAFEGIEELGASRSMAYDAEFRAKRDAALAKAGYTVIRGNVSERMETP